MDIKENLKHYRTTKLELEEIEHEINSKCIKSSVQGSQKDFPFVLQNHKVEGVPSEDFQLLERKAEKSAELKKVDNFIENIKDARIQKAMRIYYTDPIDESGDRPTWEMVADKFKDGTTAASLKMAVSRIFKKI